MRATWKWLAAGLLTLGLATPSQAQSLYGPGGLFLHPAADMPPKGQVTPAFLFLHQKGGMMGEWNYVSASLDYGLAEDVEIGATFLETTGLGVDPSWGGYVKFRLLEEDESRPAVAVGYTHLGAGDLNTRRAFLALRKQVGGGDQRPLIAHLGVQYTDVVDGMSHHGWEPFAGLELGLGMRTRLAVEARPRLSHDSGTPFALTVSHRVSDRWKLAVTWANAGHSETPYLGFGAGYTLGVRR